MNKVIQDILTGKDGVTHDVVRWLAVATALTAILLTIFLVIYRDKPFDIQAFGIGMGVVFTTVGAALKLKETTEPGHSTITTESVTKVTDDTVVSATQSDKQ